MKIKAHTWVSTPSDLRVKCKSSLVGLETLLNLSGGFELNRRFFRVAWAALWIFQCSVINIRAETNLHNSGRVRSASMLPILRPGWNLSASSNRLSWWAVIAGRAYLLLNLQFVVATYRQESASQSADLRAKSAFRVTYAILNFALFLGWKNVGLVVVFCSTDQWKASFES